MIDQTTALLNRQGLKNTLQALATAVASAPPATGEYANGWRDGYAAAIANVAVALGLADEVKQTSVVLKEN